MGPSIASHRFFNLGTQRALFERTQGYVTRDAETAERADWLRQTYGLEEVFRLDLGQDPDGPDPLVLEHLRGLVASTEVGALLSRYPEPEYRALRQTVAAWHGIRPEWVVLSAGLDQMIALLANSFFDPGDRFMTTEPGFFLFDEYSRRRGGVPIVIRLEEAADFAWTEATDREYARLVARLRPKLIWLANPNNPTGQWLEPQRIAELVALADEHFAFVVVDEAYGEFMDTLDGPRSSSHLLANHQNLIVLRTLSKAYGLANARVGYAMTANADIRAALLLQRLYYPISSLSFELARLALGRRDWLESVRLRTDRLRADLGVAIAQWPTLRLIPSQTSVAMLRHLGSTAPALLARLEQAGLILAPVTGEGPAASQYVRLTMTNGRAQDRLIETLHAVHRGTPA